MCLLIVLSRVVTDLPLVFAGNRDERLDRPAEPMTVLRASGPRTLGGRDLTAGGTWLAVNEWGVVAALTNRPSPAGADPTKRSRGELPLALAEHRSAEAAVTAAVRDRRPSAYNPAWLLVGDRRSLFALDLTGSDALTVRELPPGFHVLENRPLEDPSPKVDQVRRRLVGIDGLPAAAVPRRLRTVLADHEIPPAAEDGSEDQGSERPAELGAACVHTEGYGTRWSGIATVSDEPTAEPAFTYTDGPPCRSPVLDASPRWATPTD